MGYLNIIKEFFYIIFHRFDLPVSILFPNDDFFLFLVFVKNKLKIDTECAHSVFFARIRIK